MLGKAKISRYYGSLDKIGMESLGPNDNLINNNKMEVRLGPIRLGYLIACPIV